VTYLSLDDFVTYVGSEIAVDEPFLARCLATAEDAVNDHCGRSFDPPTATSITRRYVPVYDVVITDDFVDTTDLVIADNGSTVALSAVQLEPVNNRSASGLTSPYCKIRRPGSRWQTDRGRATVEVTSTRWGWPAVPPQVVEATAILAKDVAHIRQNRFGTAGFGEFGVIRVRDNPHVEMLLAGLKHPAGWGIA
jgi:hypothetical protein